MKFCDRVDAGRKLAKSVVENLHARHISDFSNLIVVGLPRGGVPVAFEVAQYLDCPLEIIVSKKLPYPGQPEFAIGAVSSDGFVVTSPDIPQNSDWLGYVQEQRKRLCRETIALEQQLYKSAGRVRCTKYDGKTVIIVDDGIATGMTAVAAAETARARGAKTVYLAAPVICRESFFELNEHCNGLIATLVPEVFQSVGNHYRDFKQTTESEVVEALRNSANFGTGQRTAYAL